VSPDEIPQYYADNDIYIQSPDIDNMPTSVIEAYASGLPVVSTEAGGIPAILSSGEHGLLSPLDDHVALAQRLMLLIDDLDLRRRMGRKAYQRARESFDESNVIRSLLKIYREACVSSACLHAETVSTVGLA